MGDSTYEDTKYLRFVENGVEKKASTGSIFSEGSLTMIVAFIALIASVASIVVNIATKKKKAIVATGTEQTENNE
jgi:hypothetical protein